MLKSLWRKLLRGLEVSSYSFSCKTHAVCQRDCICTDKGMLQNIGLHTTVWGKEEALLMALTNLNLSYWCDEVLAEQGLLFIPRNKHCCRIQTVSAER